MTYSAESKRHIQKVLNLCRCIEKNGFTCCMDMYDRRMPTEDKLGWVKERFDEVRIHKGESQFFLCQNNMYSFYSFLRICMSVSSK